jgi:hypothetical protein
MEKHRPEHDRKLNGLHKSSWKCIRSWLDFSTKSKCNLVVLLTTANRTLYVQREDVTQYFLLLIYNSLFVVFLFCN